MNRDSIVSVYSDARTEYTKQLYIFLVPSYFQFFLDLLEKAKENTEPKKILWQFQTLLNEIHDWNMEKVSNEIQTIHSNCRCDYLEELLTAVFIAHTKVLTAIRLSSQHKKVDIHIPKVEHFLFKVLCECSKLLWSSSYLFRDGISSIEKQQNYRTIEGILNEGILQAIRSLVPVKSILKEFVNQESIHEDSDDDKEEEDDDKKEKDKEKEKEKDKDKDKEKEKEKEKDKDKDKEKEKDKDKEKEKEKEKEKDKHDKKDKDDDEQTIIIDDEPHVHFGPFDAVFDSDHPDDSDMKFDPKDKDPPEWDPMESSATSLDLGDFEELTTSESLSSEDYEEL